VRQRAEELYATRVRRLDQLVFEAQDTLEPAAAELGLEIEQADGVTRSTGPGIFSEEVFRDAAFGADVIERGFNSSVIEHDNVAVSLRVRTHHEAQRRPFEEMADSVRTNLLDQEARDLARRKADEALQRLLAGEAVADVVKDAKVEWRVSEGARRRMPDVPPPVLAQAFELPRPAPNDRSAGIAELEEGAVAVVVVTRVVDGDYAALTEAERKTLDRQLTQRAGEADLTAVFETVREDASIKRI
jgi:peptidyl-prolyl cis-trans isomerase D